MKDALIKLAIDNPVCPTAQDCGLPNVKADQDAWASIVNTIALIVGALAVIMIIFGALTFIFSAGSPDTAKRARTTILFAVIGLIVSIMAVTIVSFIVGKFTI